MAAVLTFLGLLLAPAAAAPVWRWLRSEPGCPASVGNDPPRFGPVAAEDLPWSRREPAELQALRGHHRTPVLAAAFFLGHAGADDASRHNAALAARRLAGHVLAPGARWSFNAQLGPYGVTRGYLPGESYAGGRVVYSAGGGVCRVSSALYNLAVMAGLEVAERHPHSMPVPYLPPGRDAAVTYGGKDLVLVNPGPDPVVIWAEAVPDGLYVAAYGRRAGPRVIWRQEVLSRQPFPTVEVPDPRLPPGTRQVRVPGAEGVVVRTWVEVEAADGTVRRRDLGTDRYAPLPRVVAVGPPR